MHRRCVSTRGDPAVSRGDSVFSSRAAVHATPPPPLLGLSGGEPAGVGVSHRGLGLHFPDG